jgi:hypothetical protein
MIKTIDKPVISLTPDKPGKLQKLPRPAVMGSPFVWLEFVPNLRQLSELSLIIAAYIVKEGRYKTATERSLYKAMNKAAEKDLHAMWKATDSDIKAATDLVFSFGKNAGWMNEKKHPVTILSFISDMIERSPHTFSPAVLESINTLIGYLENRDGINALCCFGGRSAADKWEAMFDTV